MPSSLAIKATSGLGALGTIGVGVVLYKSGIFTSKTTLGDLVKEDKWTLLTSTNASEINTILTAYKKTGAPNPTLLFTGFTGNEKDANQRLLKECEKASQKLSTDSNKDSLLKQIKKWCVIPKTVEKRLKDIGFKVFNTTDPTNPPIERTEWTAKGVEYKKSPSPISGIINTGDDNAVATALRNGCKSKNSINSYDEEFESALKISTLWCSLKTEDDSDN